MPQQTKIENIEKTINNLKGVVGVIRIAEIINKFAPTPDDRMAIFDYFYKVLDKEITVKEFAQSLLQKLSIKQEDKKRLIIEINQKIFRFLEDYLKKEPASELHQGLRPATQKLQRGEQGEPFAPQKEIQAPPPKVEQAPGQILRPEASRPAMPKLVVPPRPPLRPQASRPVMPPETSTPIADTKPIADSRQQGVEIARQQPAAIAKPTADSRQQTAAIARQVAGSRDSDRYREPVPEEPGKSQPQADSRQQAAAIEKQEADSRRQVADSRDSAIAKPEPKIQGNIVDLRNNF